jgi:exonuclease III
MSQAKENVFNICSFNCNGLNNASKRKDVFDYIRNKNWNIIFLQESHLLTKDEHFIRTCWGYEVIVCGNYTNKNGVTILFNNNFEYKVLDVKKDVDGCFIAVSIEFLKKRFTLINLYGPSSGDKPGFFDSITKIIELYNNDAVVIAGDWNCYLDRDLDVRNYASTVNRPRTRKKIMEIMAAYDLYDVFRELYPEKRQYTWRQFNSIKQSRLDYFLLSENLMNDVNNIYIEPGYRSDHSFVVLSFNKEQFIRDRPFWKFNNSLLKDIEYVNEIKNIILDTKKQYALPVYNFDNLSEVDNNMLFFNISDQLFFETVLLAIRGKTISYATYKKRSDNEREKDLEKGISILENSLDAHNIDDLEQLKLELEEIRESKIQGAAVRSRARWLLQGEKVNKYFCNMESRNYLDKSMPLLERDNRVIITSQSGILQEVQTFYKKLYKLEGVEDLKLENENWNAPKLDVNDIAATEGLISYEEAIAALRKMKNDKSPGPDGFSVEFFKFFFVDIGFFLVRSVNEGFTKGELSVTQKQGMIVCIPKEGKSKRFIKNWRPISLLNTTYKIVSSCIANRLKRVLPKIIHESQRGFLKGRYIGENVRLLYDTMLYADRANIPGMFLLIDFEKAFDSVSWSFMLKCLEFFNFGPDLICWIKTFYNNIFSCISVNGQYSSWFNVERGCRQGDPSSCYLYLICAEVLSLMIRKNVNIKGINIKGKECLLSQFADDTTLCLDGSEKSFNETMSVLSKFTRISGLKVNIDKTQIVWIGSMKGSDIRYMRDKNFIWDPGTFKALGIIFSTDTNRIVQLNYDNKLLSIKRILNAWNKRNLTAFGKIAIIKSLALSKIVHLFINLPDPPVEVISALEKEFFKFLWDGRPSKIKKINHLQTILRRRS